MTAARFGCLLLALALSTGAAQAQQFAQADINHDGFVTYKEATGMFPRLSQVTFNKFDRDHDGRLTPPQWVQLNNFWEMFNFER